MWTWTIYIFLLLLTCSCLADCPTDTGCDSNLNKCFKYVPEEREYLSAEEKCQEFGGHLTSIKNVFENEKIKSTAQSMFNGYSDVWIGGNRLNNNTWTWTDASPWSFTNWVNGYPGDPQAASMILQNGLWQAAAPYERKAFVCELPFASPSVTPTPPKHNCPVCSTQPTPAPVTCKAFCDDGWTHLNGFCYRVIPIYTTFSDAEDQCVFSGAHLVSIHSEEENNFVMDMASIGRPTVTRSWIGMNKINGQWYYTDNTPADYFKWSTGQPDNWENKEGCVTVYPDGWNYSVWQYDKKSWDDDVCDHYDGDRNFICKKPRY